MLAVEFALHLTLLDLIRWCHPVHDLIFLITTVDSISLLISEVIPLSCEYFAVRSMTVCVPDSDVHSPRLTASACRQAVHVEIYQV
jgi:hypothetical protein